MTSDLSVQSDMFDDRPGDLDLRRARSELERAAQLAVAGELVAAITHDLRQPLTALEMNVSAAIHFLRRPVPRIPETIEALEDALGQQRRMRDSLQVLQDLAVRREPFYEAIDTVAIVRDVVRLVGTDAAARHVPLELDVVTPIPSVLGDVMLFRQALLNVVLDALEATSLSSHRNGTVRVTVRRSDDTVEVSVAHFGLRAEAAVLEDWGLAVARSVVDAHRASIVLEGDADSGVRVVTRWPIRAVRSAGGEATHAR